ncbi:MAG: tripartite tricarboxylate transporter substrate binding protein [Burkholderiales bacterium]|nr:tripartite tricarboxylate transporter substrate binding protein [Burkholderiales bacterium]
MEAETRTRTLLAAAAMALAVPASAQQWPEKPVRMLVPFAPGGGTDIQARLLAGAFQKSLGQSFIIDNRTGASGLIATQLAVEAPADGNTLLFTSGSLSVVTTLYAKRLKFSPLADLAPVSWLSSTPLVLSLHPSVPAKSVKDLVALAKAKPAFMNAGGNSVGSTAHLSAEMLNQMAGIKSTVLTYRGGGPAVIALISGETDYIFATAPSIMPHLRSGKAKAIAVTTAKPSSAFPHLPTMNTIYPGFESDNWYAVFFPKNTPRAIVERMNAEIRKALAADEIRKFMAQEALDPVASSPEELTAMFKRDIDKYAKVIRFANIRLD